ncbi:type I restriction endonuclease subunit R [Deinococcus sp. UR1]|uniref:type I restriction endonuclease subunit R n=1 Tax=Deinococcus sp. UR1 TaxID=1704277 RepID=UPI000C197ED2|nr:HsdR family type I site-specific deoxyribonuclease [Deinococcus sp. UR1]PIG95923.1 deoxyribonuclease HsdR [Deinococcus sp. UR1]
MSTIRISEAGSSQYPMVKHAEELGWQPLTPADALSLRGGVAGLFLRPVLEAKIQQFNPWMSADTVRSVVETLDALPPTIEGNRDMLSWLRGERSVYDDGEKRHRRVQLIDFDDSNQNDLQVSWEWKIKPVARPKGNRADVVFVVNGIPVCIVEHKNPDAGDAIEKAVNQLRRYEVETPELIAAAQSFFVAHTVDSWYGVTWRVSKRDMARWKQTQTERYRYSVQTHFEPMDFLRTLQHWILFYDQDSEVRKSILRQHQRLAIDAILARCLDPEKTRGLIWHTQGSGKTFTLLTAARLILEDREQFRNATVILVVDRTELEGQLRGWVERLLGELQRQDVAVKRANNKDELQTLLDADFRGLIVSMIHKFDAIKKHSSERDNIYVFIDEAHRSVAKDLGSYLMAALPNATIMGFTGTPTQDKSKGNSTAAIFGRDDEKGFTHKYSNRESVEDGTTLPIRHTMAPSTMTIPTEQLEREFFSLAALEGVTDIDELNAVLARAVGLSSFLSSDDHIEQVAEFVAGHFRENVLPLGYKAFVVAVNREACAKYKRALDRYLPPEWSEAVYTSSPTDVVDRPLVAQLQLSAAREEAVRLSFKKSAEEPKILIVTDKLLTGYDAPVLYALYLDKPMRDHVLLQALARVNRPYEDADGNQKPVGLVVDFVGVLRDMRKALTLDSHDIEGVIEDLSVLMDDFKAKMTQAQQNYLETTVVGSADEKLEELIYVRLLDPADRKTFFDRFKEIETLWEILSPDAELRDFIPSYKQLGQLYATVRNAYAERVSPTADLANKTKELIATTAQQQGITLLPKSVTFDVETLGSLQGGTGSDEGKVFNLVRGLRQQVEESPAAAPILQSIKERAERVLDDMAHRRISGIAAMDSLEALAAEKDAAMREAAQSGLSMRAFAVAWALRQHAALSTAGIDPNDVAREADGLLVRFPNAAVNEDEQRHFRAALYRPLIRLPAADRSQIADQVMQAFFGVTDA